MELLHQSGEIIAERYQIIDTLGQGGSGTTYQAQDLQSGERVALKALSLRRMTDWKMLELFEREARILAHLTHPGIPDYLDYFCVDTTQDRSFYIAQQLAPGKSLAALVENGWQPDESEVRHLATQILEILIYLHSLTPPVIHRDIKPQNIIRQENGQVFLVDFGAVQDTYHHTVTGGSTVVGTYGYMAPEQFRGQAVLSTDLYGLGTTLLFLLTQKSPADLPQRKLKINFRSHVKISKEFADWLERMLEPVVEDRFHSASQALAVLRGELAMPRSLGQKSHPPKYTPITLVETEQRLVVEIPPVWLRSRHSQIFALIPLVWSGFLLLSIWINLVVNTQPYDTAIALSYWIFLSIYGLVGLWMLGIFLLSAASRIQLEIDEQNFRLQRWLLGKRYQEVRGKTEDINIKLCSIGLTLHKKPITVCLLRSKLRQYRFGSFLTEPEKEWLVGAIASQNQKYSYNTASSAGHY